MITLPNKTPRQVSEDLAETIRYVAEMRRVLSLDNEELRALSLSEYGVDVSEPLGLAADVLAEFIPLDRRYVRWQLAVSIRDGVPIHDALTEVCLNFIISELASLSYILHGLSKRRLLFLEIAPMLAILAQRLGQVLDIDVTSTAYGGPPFADVLAALEGEHD